MEELQAELEEKRLAVALGSDEALAMILHLQAEKAAERMKVEQFRHVVEERIQHDEDTLTFLRPSSSSRRWRSAHSTTGYSPSTPPVTTRSRRPLPSTSPGLGSWPRTALHRGGTRPSRRRTCAVKTEGRRTSLRREMAVGEWLQAVLKCHPRYPSQPLQSTV